MAHVKTLAGYPDRPGSLMSMLNSTSALVADFAAWRKSLAKPTAMVEPPPDPSKHIGHTEPPVPVPDAVAALIANLNSLR